MFHIKVNTCKGLINKGSAMLRRSVALRQIGTTSLTHSLTRSGAVEQCMLWCSVVHTVVQRSDAVERWSGAAE